MIKSITSSSPYITVTGGSPMTPYFSPGAQGAGQMRFNTSSNNIEVWDGVTWKAFRSMNERIEELAEQAGAVRYDFDTLDGTNLEELNKFAQLIVQECMLQCDVPESGNTPLSKDFNEGHIMGVYECFHKIKNHFGVEE